jgi:hypothetical protein
MFICVHAHYSALYRIHGEMNIITIYRDVKREMENQYHSYDCKFLCKIFKISRPIVRLKERKIKKAKNTYSNSEIRSVHFQTEDRTGFVHHFNDTDVKKVQKDQINHFCDGGRILL